MPMPWILEYHPFGPRGDKRAVKRYPNGMVAMASAEDVEIAEHVATLEIERDTINACYNELEKRLESEQQKQPATAGAKRK